MGLCRPLLAVLCLLVLSTPGNSQGVPVRSDSAANPTRPTRPTTRPTRPSDKPAEAAVAQQEPVRPDGSSKPAGNDGTPCRCMKWTPWINADNDDSDGGDFETIGYNLTIEGNEPGRVTRHLAKLEMSCNTPITIECRDADTGAVWHTVGDNTKFGSRINCDSERGFICRDSEQADGKCHDYEVRLLCWTECEELQWHTWFDKDDPSGDCDCEHPGWQDDPARHAPPCPDGKAPVEVLCETLLGVPAALASDDKVRCSVNGGFTCINDDQTSGSCDDYQVRYLCIA